MATPSEFLSGKSHGQRSLADYIHVVARVRHDSGNKPAPYIKRLLKLVTY